MKKYKTPLSHPLPNRVGLLDRMGHRQEDFERKVALLEHLFAEYDIELSSKGKLVPEHWRRLALALAVAHVPAFQAKSVRGRPKKWTFQRIRELAAAVNTRLGETGETEHEALTFLANRSPWLELLDVDRGDKADALRKQYKMYPSDWK